MTTSVISNTIRDGSGTAIGSVPVSARLRRGFFRVDDSSEIAGYETTTSNGSGAWTLTLERQSNIVPGGSYWEIVEDIPAAQGGPRQWSIVVPDINATLKAAAAITLPLPEAVPVGGIYQGLLANRPSPGNAGHTYYATDTGQWFYDDGVTWTVISGGALTGTWSTMQATTPTLGRGFYTTDQGLQYVGTGSVWRRMNGDPNEIWATDYGAVPTSASPPSAGTQTANATAIQAAVDAAEAAPIAGVYTGVDARVYLNATALGSYFYTNTGIDIYEASMTGRGNVHGQFSKGSDRAALVNTAANGYAVKVDTSGGPAIGSSSHFHNLLLWGDDQGAWVKNRALVSFTQCDFYYNYDAARANNAGLVIENVFWLIVDKFSTLDVTGTTPTSWDARGNTGILIIASDGGPIAGIGEAMFRDGVLASGCVRLENRTTVQIGDSADVVFDNVLTEGQGPQAMFQFAVNGGTAPHNCVNFDFIHCERADAAAVGTASNQSRAFVTIGPVVGSGYVVLKDSSFHRCAPYAAYMVRTSDANTVVHRLVTDTDGSLGLFFDPAHNPGANALGTIRMGSEHFAGIAVNLLDDPAMDFLKRSNGSVVGGSAAEAEARLRWAIGARGQYVVGDGTNAGDTMMQRGQAGAFEVPLATCTGHNPSDADFLQTPANKTVCVRTDGAAGSRIWMRLGGVWTALA